jgi:NAD(P)-dependent dehydrogenase (short-subunit alcohol dehydrogenase family)
MRLRGDATYLITGGLGGLGLEVARWMVERGARHLLLVGRRGAAGRGAEAVAALEQAGAKVTVAQADVSQADQLAAALWGMGSSRPRLRGVVHAAGVLDDGVLLQQSWEKFARVMAPKVSGAWNLHRLVEREELDFFVLFSSVSSLLGSPGQANHAAANAFLDALAHHRRALGLPAMSINWGVWSDVGSAAKRNVGARVGLQGMGSFSAAEGIRLLERLLAAGPAQVAVMPVNWPRFRQAMRIASPYFAELDTANQAAPRPLDEGRTDLRKQLQGAPPNQRRKMLLAHVRVQALKVLGLGSAEEIDVRQPLNELGLDSLMAVELRNLLGAGLGGEKSLPATLVFDHPSIAELTDYLAQEVLGFGAESPARPESGGSLLDRIERLSDDEVDRLLGAGTPRTDP